MPPKMYDGMSYKPKSKTRWPLWSILIIIINPMTYYYFKRKFQRLNAIRAFINTKS